MANLNFNKAIIGGRLTGDPEIRQTQNGKSVCQFTVAVNRKGVDAQTDFISCVAWEKRAEFLEKYFRKGSSICVVGEIQVRKWQDKNGENRYTTEVLVGEINFVDSKEENGGRYAAIDAQPQENAFTEVGDDDDLPF